MTARACPAPHPTVPRRPDPSRRPGSILRWPTRATPYRQPGPARHSSRLSRVCPAHTDNPCPSHRRSSAGCALPTCHSECLPRSILSSPTTPDATPRDFTARPFTDGPTLRPPTHRQPSRIAPTVLPTVSPPRVLSRRPIPVQLRSAAAPNPPLPAPTTHLRRAARPSPSLPSRTDNPARPMASHADKPHPFHAAPVRTDVPDLPAPVRLPPRHLSPTSQRTNR